MESYFYISSPFLSSAPVVFPFRPPSPLMLLPMPNLSSAPSLSETVHLALRGVVVGPSGLNGLYGGEHGVSAALR